MLHRVVLAVSLALALGACGGTEDPGPDDDDDDAIVEPDAGTAAGDPDAAAGDDLGYMQGCDPAADLCGDGLVCFMFNSRGPFCTHDCTFDTDCPSPSRGCNNMGVCKAP